MTGGGDTNEKKGVRVNKCCWESSDTIGRDMILPGLLPGARAALLERSARKKKHQSYRRFGAQLGGLNKGVYR